MTRWVISSINASWRSKPVAWNAFPMAFEILDAEKSSRFPSRLIMQMSAVFIRLVFLSET